MILGGTARVSTAVSNDVRSVLPQVTLDRIAGDDRYDTSAEVALDTWDTASSAVLAQGQASVDAVAGTQLAAYQDAPLVLTRKSCQPPLVRQALATLGTDLHTLLGGTAVIDSGAGTNAC